MTDKELLKNAAKSIKLQHREYCDYSAGPYDRRDGSIRGLLTENRFCEIRLWNSLENDADALRLKNRLRMCVIYTDQGVNVTYDDVLLAFEPWGEDDLKAERRAITRAAAAMADK